LRWAVLDRLTGRRRVAPPGPPASSVEPDLSAIHDPSARPRLTWLGHASVLASLGGASLLIDPVLGRRVARVIRRHGAPPLGADRLPRLSCVLISHNHYDHLDLATLRRLPREVPAVLPRGLGRWLGRRHRRPIVELDWWQSVAIEGLTITLVPARHWSRRGAFDLNRVLWGGFVIEGSGGALYHAGDSAWFEGFAEIGTRFPGLLAALLPIGAYEPAWFMGRNHLNPEQAGEAFLACGARTLVPIHWGSFQLTDEALCEPVERLRAWWEASRPAGRRLAVLAVGETLPLDEEAESGKR
jgi:L-ascorbate metabolism protein UlaG (beta-lactamase superfamily)